MKIRVFAPATVANVAVGFDILGFAIDGLGDTIELRKSDSPEVRILNVDGVTDTPRESDKNTATIGLLQLIKDQKLKFGFDVLITKGIPMGSGLGGSAASAVGAIFAANYFLPTLLSREELMHYALMGESFASRSFHADNIAPCLFGGMTYVTPSNDVHEINYPKELICILVKPDISINTKDARNILKDNLSLKDHIQQSSNLAGFLLSCFNNDLNLMRKSLSDVVIEPQRAKLIPYFEEVKTAALKGGSIGCSISGSGPTLFALAQSPDALIIKNAMEAAFNDNGIKCQSWLSPISPKGARRL
jgi:homoserine kinase